MQDPIAKSNEVATPNRTILFVDNDGYASALRDVWPELGLGANLKVMQHYEDALTILWDAELKGNGASITAIVVDPEVTGEETGVFLRQVQDTASDNHVPLLLWTRDVERYDVLEGSAVDLVLQKPMFLRLIRALDSANERPRASYSA